MIKKLFHNLFDRSRQIELSAGDFNHCASVCAHRDGVLVAWYAGTGECEDDQNVHVIYISDHYQSEPLKIGDKTGNPVLIPYDNDYAVLVWSRFEDTDKLRRKVDRWKYCSLWATFVGYDGRCIHFWPPKRPTAPKQLAAPHQHLLGRCNPITHRGLYLLPLYDEVARRGVIFWGIGQDYKYIGHFGEDMIQPTLWAEKDRIYALSRNFMNKTRFKSCYCYSDNGGETWSAPQPTQIMNRNSSLHVLKWRNRNFIIWNDTPNLRRENITFGVLDGITVNKIAVLDSYGAYPSMCIDRNDDLNMAYTSVNKTIILRTWNHKHLRNMEKK